MISFTINTLPTSRNQLDSKHWTVRGNAKRAWEAEVIYAAKQAKLKPIKGRVDVSIVYHFADNRRHDPHDNYSHKGTFDALVKLGILEDDNYKIIRRQTTEGIHAEKPAVIITIIPLDKTTE